MKLGDKSIAALVVVLGVVVAVPIARGGVHDSRCGAGFVRDGASCRPGVNAPPLDLEARVVISAARLDLTAADWEQSARQNRAAVDVPAFAIDAFEANDHGRARGGMSYDDAVAHCTHRGGHVPSEPEWVRAFTARRDPSAKLTRYPWGETGAVCRRAAWGYALRSDPPDRSEAEGKTRHAERALAMCGYFADAPDYVGAHAAGDTELGVHDMAGNVAEWALALDGAPVVKGGSFLSNSASELRYWWRDNLPRDSHEPGVGVRCAYAL